jgi:hypothetical protein
MLISSTKDATHDIKYIYLHYRIGKVEIIDGDYLHRIYPKELVVNDTTDTQKSASFLDIYLEIDNGGR